MIRFILADEEHAARLDEIDGCRLSTAEVLARLPGAQILDPGEFARRWNDGELEGRRAAVFDDCGGGRHGEAIDADSLGRDALIRLALLWYAPELSHRLGNEYDLEEWPEWMFGRRMPGRGDQAEPAVLALYLENDPAVYDEFSARVAARVRRLQSQQARP